MGAVVIRATQGVLDDVVAAVLPARCRCCGRGVGEDDGSAMSRLVNGAMRRSFVGPWSVRLPLLCAACAGRIRPRLNVHRETGPRVVSVFEPGPELFALVHAFKYEGVVELAEWFGVRMTRAARHVCPRSSLLLVPVPLHAERLQRRGFNQSELLAAVVGRKLGAPVHVGLLARHRSTPPLARLPRSARAAQVQGAFVRTGPPPPGAPFVLLVDDVVTTGATSTAALEALGMEPQQTAVLCLCRALGDAAPHGVHPGL